MIAFLLPDFLHKSEMKIKLINCEQSRIMFFVFEIYMIVVCVIT